VGKNPRKSEGLEEKPLEGKPDPKKATGEDLGKKKSGGSKEVFFGNLWGT